MQSLSCDNCDLPYSADNEPLLLPCGHTLCRHCVKSYHESTGKVYCPYQQITYFRTPASLPINHSVAEFIVPESRSKGKYVVTDFQKGKIFFFNGNVYYRFDSAAEKVDPNYPAGIAVGWRGVWPDGIDACYSASKEKAYFFKGKEYVAYDVVKDVIFPGYPKPIKGNWNNMPFDSVDAAVNNGKGKVYFFKGNQYCRHDIKSDKTDPEYPAPISKGWKGVWPDGIDSATIWSKQPGKIFFFKGRHFVRFDLDKDTTDAGYPQSVKAWKGIPQVSP